MDRGATIVEVDPATSFSNYTLGEHVLAAAQWGRNFAAGRLSLHLLASQAFPELRVH